jgi:RHS repeat-associated protein
MRYYSAAQGRFLSPDEYKGEPDDALTGVDITPPGPLPYANIGNPQTLNKYAYVINNPLRYTNPDGRLLDTLADIGFIGYDIYTLCKEGSTKTNWNALGADVLGACVPFRIWRWTCRTRGSEG